MEHNIEGNNLRDCIDKSFDAGYNEAVRLAGLWLSLNLADMNVSDANWWLNDFKDYMEISKCE